ncbi:hypothetical protein PtB15_9B592 [Puccinia triticina]|nr:hypothetical protein PtB15_9B592 [Puccinia triticina]
MGRLLSTSILVVLLGFQSLVQTMRQHNEELFEWSDQMRAIDAANAVEEAAMEAARLEEEARYHAQFPPPPPLPDCPFCERPYTVAPASRFKCPELKRCIHGTPDPSGAKCTFTSPARWIQCGGCEPGDLLRRPVHDDCDKQQHIIECPITCRRRR